MIWLDAQLPPALARWIFLNFDVPCSPVRDLSLRDAPDWLIFQQAREANVIVITKDRDFVELLHQNGPPPQIIWLTCGNASTSKLKALFTSMLPAALKMLESDTDLVEIQ